MMSPAILLLGAILLAVAAGGGLPADAVNNNSLPADDPVKPLAEAVPQVARTFIKETCARCHNSEKKMGRLDLTTLAYDAEDRGNFALWVKVHDRAAAGEMPPEDAKQPDPAKRKAFVANLAETFLASENRQMAGEGRAIQRRMNRFEYEDALRDLLGIPMAQIANQLPQDGEAYRFNKSAEALDVSYVTMQRFISAADSATRQAISQKLIQPPRTIVKLYARDEPSLSRFRPAENGTLPDRLAFPVLDSHGQQDVRLGRAPSPARRRASARRSARSQAFSATRGDTVGAFAPRHRTLSPQAGRLHDLGRRRRDRTLVLRRTGAQKAPVYHLPLWHRPELDEVWPGRNNEPIGFYASGNGQTRPIGAADLRRSQPSAMWM